MRHAVPLAVMTLASAGLSGCAGQPEGARADAAPAEAPVYKGAQVVALDADLIQVQAALQGGDDPEAVAAYARCAAARYAQTRGFGFARHVRTMVAQEDGIWRGDAVYTLSAALPPGLRTIDTEVTVADCAEQGIPTV